MANSNIIKRVQKKLELTQDGIIGKNTIEVIKKWQSEHGLVVDGIVGNKTFNKMFFLERVDRLKGYVKFTVIEAILKSSLVNNPPSLLELIHLLTQIDHETGGFANMSENLNYSAKGLIATFPSRFTIKTEDGKVIPEITKAEEYKHNPVKIANYVYANKLGNGDEQSGDGWKFRGRGMGLTGKYNYIQFNEYLISIGKTQYANPVYSLINVPATVAIDEWFESGIFFFEENKIWPICNRGCSNDVIAEVTRKINPPLVGLHNRIRRFERYKNMLLVGDELTYGYTV
jgi:putative chitinase